MIKFPKIIPKWINKKHKHICGQCILYTDGATEIEVYHGHPENHGFNQFEVIVHEFVHWIGYGISWNWHNHTFWDCISSDISNIIHLKVKKFVFTLNYIRGKYKNDNS